jgi:hypothetical protein
MPNATVTATKQSANAGVHAVSDADGNYQILFLNSGIYEQTDSSTLNSCIGEHMLFPRGLSRETRRDVTSLCEDLSAGPDYAAVSQVRAFGPSSAQETRRVAGPEFPMQ